MKTPPQLILENPELLNNLRTLFGEYVDENSNPVKGKEKELEKLLDKLHRVGIDEKSTLKQKGIALEQWNEYLQQNAQTTQTEAPQYEAPTTSNIPQKGLREVQEAELAAREAAVAAAKEKGVEQTKEFIESQLKRVKAIKVDPKEKIPEVTLNQEDKEKLRDMGVAAKTDPGTAQKIIEEKIEESLAKSAEKVRGAVPEEIVTKAAVDLVDKVKPYGDYATATEIPTKVQAMNPASPIAAVAVLNDAKLKGLITDEEMRKILVENAQTLALALENERGVNSTLTNSIFYKYPNISSVLYGPEQITKFEISDDQSERNQEGVDVDLREVVDRGKDIRDFWGKIASGKTSVSEASEATTTFVTRYTPSVNIAISSQASSLISKALPATAAIVGFKTGALAQQWLIQGAPRLMSPQIAGWLTSGGTQQIIASSAFTSKFAIQTVSGKYGLAIATGKNVYGANVLMGGLKIGGSKIAIAASATGTKVAASGIFARIGAFLGSAGPIVGTLIGAAVGWLVGKVIEKIPWKKVLPVLAGIAGFFLFGPLIGLGLGLGTAALIGAGSGIGVGATLAGIGTGVVGFFGALGSAMVISIGTPILVTLLVFPVVVALILFIINSGAYVVPPGVIGTSIIHIPPGGNLTKCDPEKTGTDITEQLASSIRNGSVYLLPNSLGSRKDGICMDPTMIILHTSSGYDNDDGNIRTYETLVARNVSCQLATDTNDTILMLNFFEKQVEFAWCADNLNAGGVSIEMAGEPDPGFGPFSKCAPTGNQTFTPNGPHPCLDEEDLAFDAICKTMQQYKIPWTQIFQHEASNGTHVDPNGDEWVDKFITRFKNNCPV